MNKKLVIFLSFVFVFLLLPKISLAMTVGMGRGIQENKNPYRSFNVYGNACWDVHQNWNNDMGGFWDNWWLNPPTIISPTTYFDLSSFDLTTAEYGCREVVLSYVRTDPLYGGYGDFSLALEWRRASDDKLIFSKGPFYLADPGEGYWYSSGWGALSWIGNLSYQTFGYDEIMDDGTYYVKWTLSGGASDSGTTYFNVSGTNPYPTDTWQTWWADNPGSYGFTNWLYRGPEEKEGSATKFLKDWGSNKLAYSKSDAIGFVAAKNLYFPAGSYKFTINSDDGAKLFVDGTSQINIWSGGGSSEATVNFPNDGSHSFQLEYYENTGTGNISLGYTQAATCSSLSFPTDKWQRVWKDSDGNCLGDGPDEANPTFDNDWNCPGCTGVLAHNKSDQIKFFSSRKINFPAGKYRFTLKSDDGSILYIDGTAAINNWGNHDYPGSVTTKDVDLEAGNHNLELHYYENTGDARLSFDYYQLQPTKVDCAFSNCIFDKTGLDCYGDRAAVGGYLRKTDGTPVSGQPLSLWKKKADGNYEKVIDIGNTDSTGYAARYWRPENTTYWDSQNYLVLWGGNDNYQASQTSDYSLTVPRETCGQVDCNTEMTRRGYLSGACAPNANGACSSYTNKDIVGEVGKCSQNAFLSDVAIWCSGCYDCPNSMPSDTITIAGCNISISGQGWDTTDNELGRSYHKFNANGNWQEGVMDDNGCGGDNLKIKNTWSVSGNQFYITTDADRLGNTTHDVTAGFNLSSNCKISEVGKTATGGSGTDPSNTAASCSTSATYKAKTNEGYTTYAFKAEYCGDSVVSCGEACDPGANPNCKSDCTGYNDTTDPTVTISLVAPPASGWLKEGLYYVLITDTDTGSGIDTTQCKYKIEQWTVGGNTFVNNKLDLTDRLSCINIIEINVGPNSYQLNAEGAKIYKIIATTKDKVGRSATGELWLYLDRTNPTVE